jgi:LL-diaminopimelate aminotransferase
MLNINKNYLNLENNYLFSKISIEKKKFSLKNKNKLIDLSIGDVTLPLSNSTIEGIDKAKKILSCKETFEGYPPSSGHSFLKEQIIINDYNKRNINFDEDEIFISDSSKSDIFNILNIFSNVTVAIQDPVYPVYVDSNIIYGNNIIYYNSIDELLLNIEDNKTSIDILYVCSPNNPTGEVLDKNTLSNIVTYAIKYNFIIFFDSAYESFIQDETLPHSIFEIEDAKKVAIEFKSYSKTAGFTPIRLSYTVIPKDIKILNEEICINNLFKRLKDTNYNGPSFLSEYAIYNVYINNNLDELKNNISYYLENTKILFDFFKRKDLIPKNSKNVNSPYVWITTPNNIKSWDFFYYLLENYMIVGTPGAGFGKNGEYHFRFTGFGTRKDTIDAIKRLENMQF